MKNNIIILLMAGTFLFYFSACKKQEVFKEVDYKSINAVVNDNFNLSLFGAALYRTGMNTILQEQQGPFTAFVPSDDAFANVGLSNTKLLNILSDEKLANMVNYHVAQGNFELNKFPYLINQEIPAAKGKLFVSRWIKGKDTLLTINGAKVILQDFSASNGRVQVINRVLEPYQYDYLSDAVAGDSVTLFAEALRRCGLMETLKGAGPYTVFAPSNTALRKAGYTSIQVVKDTSPHKLRELCEFHIASDRRFINDYVLSTGSSNISTQRMINTFTVTVELVPDYSGDFKGILLVAPGNTTKVEVVRRDILAGNGILHIINDVLKLTR